MLFGMDELINGIHACNIVQEFRGLQLNMIMEMVKLFFFALLGNFAFTSLVHAQSGFISIDCGMSEDSNYTDGTTGITYMSDATFIDTGMSMNISSKFRTASISQQLLNVRSFPKGMKSCYVLTPPQATINATYLIRASFLYGDYDGQDAVPEFDLHLGVNKWDTVSFFNSSTVMTKEIVHVTSSKIIYVCLINTGSGIPFISSLELRSTNKVYATESGSLQLFKRLNFGSTTNNLVRYKDDVYDRIWEPFYPDQTKLLNSTLPFSIIDFDVPRTVIGTAITPQNANEPLNFYWNFPTYNSKIYFYMYFAELQQLQINQYREFNISVNGNLRYGPVVPGYLQMNPIYSLAPEITERLDLSFYRTESSTLPPIISAIEIYTKIEFLQSQTYQEDADAMMNIKSSYRVKRNWQGDPCAPQKYSWDGVQCNYSASVPPRIISLNLSSSGLTGEISPYISNLKSIQHLDLSNNNLTGRVPDFLSQLPSLRVINLLHTNLTGPLPEALLEKSKNGTISLSFNDASVDDKKKNIVAIIASVAASFIVLIALISMWTYTRISRKEKVMELGKAKLKGRLLDTTNRKFTYSEVLIITNNLETVIGKGGFGPVYHGYLEDTEVAVKMLSSSSLQGYKEFRAEVEFLTRVHHINLTSLVGYCDDGNNVGLIYEYMANGNLKEHLSGADRNPNVLSWGERLRIALDAATGLEYLHNGCKPPIIHRDVKSANILLNEKLQAKLADFGLSKAFPVDNTHVSTAIAGTLGYLDPEYYTSCKLNEKSDIFSFGVVLLEIITGRSVITSDTENAHISKWVSFMLATEGDITSVVDTRLGGDFEVNSVHKALEIAMACASPTFIQRPTMNDVVIELKHCLVTELARLNQGRETQLQGASLNFDSESRLEGR